ncbi:CAAD domain-containing protein, partial [Okeania sp.]|uniref:CAAD domain-containing protein n=1 Tax=Okeania sp. TaxID=3100323 RepID=UPI002B4B6F4B
VDKDKVAETKVATPTTPPVVDKDKVAETKVATPTTPPVAEQVKVAAKTKTATPTNPKTVVAESKAATPATTTNSNAEEHQPQRKIVGSVLLALLILVLGISLIQALQGISIFSVSFEIIGIGYVCWFIYRYLLRKSDRQELLDKIQQIKGEIIGKESLK